MRKYCACVSVKFPEELGCGELPASQPFNAVAVAFAVADTVRCYPVYIVATSEEVRLGQRSAS